YWMYIPNSFTPDHDGLNDNFCIKYHGIIEKTFLFQVFNDNGDLMYQSINPDNLKCSNNENGWDGKHFITQKGVPSDSYVYEMYFQDIEGWKHKEYGNIILIR
ncbi:gliding motility-associated C-terminal domain-containing protein, partial [Flavobacteriales bacterium]|nr:gliding motility-associated C-terminal domain-containing protein [Flavobacteriales bacterium]